MIGSTTTSLGTWSITLAAGYNVYAGGILTATTQTASNVESICSQNITVSCVAPSAPTASSPNYVVCLNSSFTTIVNPSTEGIIYTLRNTSGTVEKSVSVMGNGGSISLNSFPIGSDQETKLFATKIGRNVCETGSASNISVDVNNLTAGSISGSQAVFSGSDPAAFTIQSVATGEGTISYQWQSSITSPSTGFSDISGAIGDTYDPPAGFTQTTYYKRITKSEKSGVLCASESNVLTVSLTALPVELLFFKAHSLVNKVKLDWATASETNNDFFEIQHSIDGNEFRKTGIVYSDYHNSNTLIKYSYDHTNPFPGLNYYRLKQTDLDGKFEYSNIIKVSFEQKNGFSIHPNPAKNELFLSFRNILSEEIQLVILNSIGNEIWTENIINDGKSITINLEKFPAGLFFIRANASGQSFFQKVLVIK